MNKKQDLEFFGNEKAMIGNEGLAYYIIDCTGPETYNDYPEIKEKFIKAKEALIDYRDSIDNEIIKAGGDPDDFEA